MDTSPFSDRLLLDLDLVFAYAGPACSTSYFSSDISPSGDRLSPTSFSRSLVRALIDRLQAQNRSNHALELYLTELRFFLLELCRRRSDPWHADLGQLRMSHNGRSDGFGADDLSFSSVLVSS
jgi:hypothetical protein